MKKRSYLVYKIVNIENKKTYVGITSQPIELRWLHHQIDAYDKKRQHLSFYQDILTYGANNFTIEILEKDLSKSESEDLEQKWIKALKSQENGYNVSLGGAGKRIVDPLVARKLFDEGKQMYEIANILGVTSATIGENLRKTGLTLEELKKRQNRDKAKAVSKIDKNTDEVLETYYSVREAARQLGNENLNGHISACCRGERKTTLGYKWQYVE